MSAGPPLSGEIEALLAAERAEALGVAAALLQQVADYWEGRPLRLHGEHIYADLVDVLAGIKADAAHNRSRSNPPEKSDA